MGEYNDIDYAYKYIYEVLSYYRKKIRDEERTELTEVTLYFLQNISDFSLDNKFLPEVWGGVVYLLRYYNIFELQDLNKLPELDNNQLYSIFEVIIKAVEYDADNYSEWKKQMSSLQLVKENENLFNSIFI